MERELRKVEMLTREVSIVKLIPHENNVCQKGMAGPLHANARSTNVLLQKTCHTF